MWLVEVVARPVVLNPVTNETKTVPISSGLFLFHLYQLLFNFHSQYLTNALRLFLLYHVLRKNLFRLADICSWLGCRVKPALLPVGRRSSLVEIKSRHIFVAAFKKHELL